MIFCRVVLGIVVYVFTAIWGIAVESRLEICFFNTGQGNCIALRSDVVWKNGVESKLIFIDCGREKTTNSYDKVLSNSLEYPGKKLKNLFKGVSTCDIFITHNHKDHTNLVDSRGKRDSVIVKVSKEAGCRVLDPIRPMSVKTLLNRLDKLSGVKALKKEGENFENIFSQRIKTSLGSQVRIIPIRPKEWRVINSVRTEHDFNIMYLVEFAGRKILFTGDINPQLFIRIMQDPKFEREIKGVDFLVMSHHGSNQAGELMIQAAMHPEMCIICSDPEGEHGLPWNEIADFQFRNGKGITVKAHSVSRRKRASTTQSGKGETQEETLPIFVTCNAAQGYYELVIASNGTARLFDGPTARGSGNFCFQSL